MTSAEVQTRPTSASSHRVIWIVIGVGVILAAVFIGIALGVRAKTSKAVQVERDKLKDRMAVLRAERVLRPNLFEPAEEGNAWDVFTKALEPFAGLPEADIEAISAYFNGEPEADRGKVDGHLAAALPHLDELKRALRRSWVEPDYRYEQGSELMIPQLNSSIRAARYLAAAAKRDHEQGKGEDAVSDILAVLGVADYIAVKAILVSELVAIVCRAIAHTALKAILSDHDLPTAALGRLARSMDRLESAKSDFQDCLRREDIVARCTARTFGERGDAQSQAIAARFFSIQDRFMEELERLAKLPAWEREEAGKKIVQEIVDTKSPLHLLLVPQVGLAWRNQWLSEAEWAVARVAVAVACFQADRGNNPASPNDLVPKYVAKIPADPCGPDSIKLVFQDSSAKVYSVGYDREDDGGKPEETNFDDEESDIVWTVKRRIDGKK